MDARKVIFGVLIGSLCLLAVIAIGAILGGDFTETTGRIVGTTLAITIYSATTFAQSSLLRDRSRWSPLAYVGIVVSALGLLTAVIAIWGDSDADDGEWRRAGVFLVLALATAHTAVLINRRRSTDTYTVKAILYATVGTLVVLAAMLIGAMWESGDEGDSFWRSVGVVLVLWALGTLLLPLVRKAQGSSRAARTDPDET